MTVSAESVWIVPISGEARAVFCVVWWLPDAELCGLEICYSCTFTDTSLLHRPWQSCSGNPQSRAAGGYVRNKPAWMRVMCGTGPPCPMWASSFVSEVAPPEKIV